MMTEAREKQRKALEQLLEDFKDPNSEASIKQRKFVEDVTKKAVQAQIKAEELYIKICSYENFEDFMDWLSVTYNQKVEQAHNEGHHIEDIDEQWDLVKVAQTYGREITEDELEKVANPFLGSAYYFKGYIFGIMNGQGSVPWYIKWDSEKLGPEQLSLI